MWAQSSSRHAEGIALLCMSCEGTTKYQISHCPPVDI